MHANVKVFSHYFLVEALTDKFEFSLFGFTKQFIEWGVIKQQGRFIRTPLKEFYLKSPDGKKIKFHIGFLLKFKDFLSTAQIKEDEISWEYIPYPEGLKVEFPIYEHFKPRDYQVPAVEYMTNLIETNPGIDTETVSNRKFLNLKMGRGKGKVTMFSMNKISERTLVVVKNMYIKKWIIELTEVFAIEPEDIMVIKGGESLKALIQLALNDELDAKIIIFSNSTLRNWFSEYEEHGLEILDAGYGCTPDELCAVLKAGIRVIDELHQDFHFNFRLDLYTNIHTSYSLSATLVSDDRFRSMIYSAVHPARLSYAEKDVDKYCAVISVLYRFKKPEKLKTTIWGRKEYNHIALEESIMRHIPTQMGYMNMINRIIQGTYIKRYKPGYRLLVFFGSIKMCTLFTEYLRKKYPYLDIRRYCEDDPYENLMEADVSVSTLISSGTAVDVKNLFITIQTTALSSSAGNLQSFGRLRPMDDGTMPVFIYLSCEDFDKHMEYDQKKREVLRDSAAAFKVEFFREPI